MTVWHVYDYSLKPRGTNVKEYAMFQHSERKNIPMIFLKKCYCLKIGVGGDMQLYLIDLDLETFSIQSGSFALSMQIPFFENTCKSFSPSDHAKNRGYDLLISWYKL